MPPSLGAFPFGAIRTATVILLSFVAATACQGNGSERLKPLPPPADLFAGEWNVTSSTSTDTCHLGSMVQPLQGRYSIRANGEFLSLSAVCISFSATGTWDGTVVMIQGDRTQVSSPTCSWHVHEVDAGTLDIEGDGFSGDASLTVSATADPTSPAKSTAPLRPSAARAPRAGSLIACFG